MGAPPAAGAPAPDMGGPANSPCDTCDARCCSAYAVHVTGDDAWRLAQGAGLPLDGFLTYRRQDAPSAVGFVLEPGGPAFDLLLAHARPSDERPPCPFLGVGAGDGARPRCGVYAFRPRACRRFPATRRGDGFRVREGLLCPPGAWTGHDMARLSWRVSLGREAREAAAYAAVVSAWNDGVARAAPRGAPTFLGYLDWLEGAYRWLVPWRSTLRPAARSGPAYLARIRETLAACRPA